MYVNSEPKLDKDENQKKPDSDEDDWESDASNNYNRA